MARGYFFIIGILVFDVSAIRIYGASGISNQPGSAPWLSDGEVPKVPFPVQLK